mgnify:CR=1 FL=1
MTDVQSLVNILTKVLDQAYEGITVVDRNGYIIYFNEAYSRIKGIKKEDAIGRTPCGAGNRRAGTGQTADDRGT